MGYQALLFCPDEKTARTVTHVLNDLDFSVEPCTEPFAAVKKLMAQHFDAVVVDCDNEQNATLLFKSARNSATNQTSLAVAVVEGQAGVAKAFRIGANLVLTKPINVEQAKGTLRVARGLLRKGADTSKGSGGVAIAQSSAPSAPVQTSVPPARPVAPVTRPITPAASANRESVSSLPPLAFAAATPKPAILGAQTPVATASSRTAEVEEHESDTILETDDAEVLDVPSAPVAKPASVTPSAPTSVAGRNFPWQLASKPAAEPMATAMRRAAEAAGHVESELVEVPVEAPAQEPRPFASLVAGRSAASATAPAKEKIQLPDEIFITSSLSMPPARAAAPSAASTPVHSEPAEPAAEKSYSEHDSFSSTYFPGGYDPDEVEGGGKTKAIVIIAAVVLLASSAAYLSWKDTHSKSTTPAVNRQSASSASDSSEAPSNHERSQETEHPEVSEITLGGSPSTASSPITKPSASRPAPKESAAVAKPKAEPEAEPEVTQRLVVKSEMRKPTPTKSQDDEPVQAPGSIEMGSPSDTKALANIGRAPVSVPKPAPQTLRVSQGVMEGLVLKKVQPKYPTQAMQLRIQGTVQLQATVTKEGDIKNLKVLSGDGLLSHAAVDAVKQWKYKPYYLNSEPVEIETQIVVNFKLPN